MDPENDAGPVVEIAVHAEPQGEGGQSDGGALETAEGVGEVADAAVQIAQIEADKEIALAVIEGENHVAAIEAHREADAEFAENIQSSELEQCRIRIAELEAENSTLKALSTPPPSDPEPLPSPPDLDPSPSEAAQDPAQDASPVAEPKPPPQRRHRWI